MVDAWTGYSSPYGGICTILEISLHGLQHGWNRSSHDPATVCPGIVPIHRRSGPAVPAVKDPISKGTKSREVDAQYSANICLFQFLDRRPGLTVSPSIRGCHGRAFQDGGGPERRGEGDQGRDRRGCRWQAHGGAQGGRDQAEQSVDVEPCVARLASSCKHSRATDDTRAPDTRVRHIRWRARAAANS